MTFYHDPTIYHDPIRLSDYIILAPEVLSSWYYMPPETLKKMINANRSRTDNIIKFCNIGVISLLHSIGFFKAVDVKKLCIVLDKIAKETECIPKLLKFYSDLETAVEFMLHDDKFATNKKIRKEIAKTINDKKIRKLFINMAPADAKDFLLGLYSTKIHAYIEWAGLEDSECRLNIPKSYDMICQIEPDNVERGKLLAALDLPVISYDLASSKVKERTERLQRLSNIDSNILNKDARRLLFSAKLFQKISVDTIEAEEKVSLYKKFKALISEFCQSQTDAQQQKLITELELLCD